MESIAQSDSVYHLTATMPAGLMAAGLAVVCDALSAGPGGLAAAWVDRPTALAALCLVIAAPLVSFRCGRAGGWVAAWLCQASCSLELS